MSVQTYQGADGVEVRCYPVAAVKTLEMSEARLAKEVATVVHNLRFGCLDSYFKMDAQIRNLENALKDRPKLHLTHQDLPSTLETS